MIEDCACDHFIHYFYSLFLDVKSPVCAVSGAQYLTTVGWTELRNPIDSDVPFRLFRDEGRTFLQVKEMTWTSFPIESRLYNSFFFFRSLQWLGEPDLRFQMQGRLVLVHLMCRDMAPISRDSLLTVDNEAGKIPIRIPYFRYLLPQHNFLGPLPGKRFQLIL